MPEFGSPSSVVERLLVGRQDGDRRHLEAARPRAIARRPRRLPERFAAARSVGFAVGVSGTADRPLAAAFSAARATVTEASSSRTRSRISWISSRSAAARSNSISRAAARISASIWATSLAISSRDIWDSSRARPPTAYAPDASATARNRSLMSRMPLTIVCGTMPCSTLYASCAVRRRAVSSIATCIDSVMRSAYMTTSPVDVARRAAGDLDQRPCRAQEALLVGVEDRDQGHLGQVDPLAQQVDADEHVVDPQSQVAQDLDPLERVHLAVQVGDLDAHLVQVVGQVLGHLLGQGRDEHALAALDAIADAVDQVVDLALGGLDA